MNANAIARHIGVAHLAIAAAMVPPALVSIDSEPRAFLGFLLGIVSAGLVAALCFAVFSATNRKAVTQNGLRELLVAFFLFWVATPVAAAVPFLVEGYQFGEAWFEAVSGLTTTGAWLSEPVARSTAYDMLYRASLQWVGGLASVATAAAIFVRPEFIGINPSIPPFARGETGSYLQAFDNAVRAFFPVYALITLFAFSGFALTGVSGVHSATMALSLIASGGFVPHQAGIEGYSHGAAVVAGVTMVLGAINFAVVATLFLQPGREPGKRRDIETIAFLALVPALALLYWVSLGAGDLSRLGEQLFNAISVLSTNGDTVGARPPPLVPILVTAIIGGAAVSTAGGIKLLRWMVTFRRTGEELWKLVHPGAVLRGGGAANEFGVWIHTVAFAVLLAALVLTTAFFGYSLEASTTIAVAVISNAGPLVALAPDMTADFIVFDPALRWLFGAGMIAGRLELVVLLAVLNRRFWE